jgi:AI-2 transport protein TqsA
MSELKRENSSATDGAEISVGGWVELSAAWSVMRWLVVAATAWFLLKELAPLLRPLLLAVFLAYVILPIHFYLMGQARGGIGHWVLLAGLLLVIGSLGALTYRDVVNLAHDVPVLHTQLKEMMEQATGFLSERVPSLAETITGTLSAEEKGAARLQSALGSMVNVTAGVFLEAIQVAFFLVLILFDAGRLPERMRAAYANEHAERIFDTIGSINAAMASYLKAKVKVNLVLALPAMLVLWLFGIKFVVLWGVVTFFANFVPYLGSVVACALPLSLGFLQFGFTWQPIAATLLLIGVHTSSAYLIEPALTGKAVDLSPLVVLIALSFWSLCWGLVGMVLAVPLTAMLKIILEEAPSTRAIGGLMGEK